MSLKNYRHKRNFKLSPEPKGKRSNKDTQQLHFVVQKHDASHLHYDFRLEIAGYLKSWAIPKGPCLDSEIKRLAIHVEDHPLEYGNFEGHIPKGEYGGGTVILWDRGTWECENDPSDAYKKGTLTFKLYGEKLKGRWKLFKTKNAANQWLLIKLPDRYVKKLDIYDICIQKPKSVISHLTIEQIANQGHGRLNDKKLSRNKQEENISAIKIQLKLSKIPTIVHPQLATLVDKPPSGEQWIHEIKFDGYRLIAIKHRNKTKLITRNNKDWTHYFAAVAAEIDQLAPENLILDGEIVVLDEQQHSNFQLLQNAIKHSQGCFKYYLFDILYIDKYNLMSLPLIERKNILKALISSAKTDVLYYSDHVVGHGNTILNKSCEFALEGIVSKNVNSAYTQKRTSDWLKTKCIKRQEFIICGFTEPKGSRKGFGSLLLATYQRNRLTYCGNVGTGFTQSSLETLYNQLEKLIVTTMPFKKKPAIPEKINWVKPLLIAEIEFSEFTESGMVRHASFKGLRSDKLPQEISIEKAMNLSNTNHITKKAKTKTIAKKNKNKTNSKSNIIKDYLFYDVFITHAHKILYPEANISKIQLLDYYDAIKEWILPYIINRPLTIVRCPDSYRACFYQKNYQENMSKFILRKLYRGKEEDKALIYIKNIKGLIALIQLASLEIHTWGSQINNIEKPDQIVFDLDPAPDVQWLEVVKAAKEIKALLLELNLQSFVKSTGGKGLHVVIPIKPHYQWEAIKRFTQTLAQEMTLRYPKQYVSKMSKQLRRGKIFIDYLRNQRGATFIAPYSTRARVDAPIATPLAWDELSKNRNDNIFILKNIMQRLNSLKIDPWKNFFSLQQEIKL